MKAKACKTKTPKDYASKPESETCRSNVKPSYAGLVRSLPSELVVMYALLFVELLGAGLAAPVIQWYMMTELKLTGFQSGCAQSAFAVAQMCGSVLFGRLSDAVGRKPLVVLAFAWSAAGFFLTGWTSAYWEVLAVRAFAGVSGGSIALTQAYVIDLSSAEDRGHRLGFLGATVALAFTLGPGFGSLIRGFDLFSRQACLFLGAGLCALPAGLAAVFMTESLPSDRRRPLVRALEGAPQRGLRALAGTRGVPEVWMTRFLSAFGTHSMYTTQSYLLREVVGAGDSAYSGVLALAGGLSVFTMGLLYPLLDGRVGPRGSVALGLSVSAAALAAFYPVSLLGLAAHCCAVAVFVLGFGCFDPGLPNVLAALVPACSLGSANGIMVACRALSQTLAPPVAGLLWDRRPGSDCIPAASALAAAGAIMLWLLRGGAPEGGAERAAAEGPTAEWSTEPGSAATEPSGASFSEGSSDASGSPKAADSPPHAKRGGEGAQARGA